MSTELANIPLARIKDLTAQNKKLEQRVDALLSALSAKAKKANDIQTTTPRKGKKPHGDA